MPGAAAGDGPMFGGHEWQPFPDCQLFNCPVLWCLRHAHEALQLRHDFCSPHSTWFVSPVFDGAKQIVPEAITLNRSDRLTALERTVNARSRPGTTKLFRCSDRRCVPYLGRKNRCPNRFCGFLIVSSNLFSAIVKSLSPSIVPRFIQTLYYVLSVVGSESTAKRSLASGNKLITPILGGLSR